MLTDDQINRAMLTVLGGTPVRIPMGWRAFAHAIEAEVRKQDTDLIRQLVMALEMPCDRWNAQQSTIVREAIDAARARLENT